MTEQTVKRFSTTRLAQRLDLPAKELFHLLVEKGWMKKQDGNWQLTGKGEFEGGSYQHSDKFGGYVVWPEEVLKHRIFTELQTAPLTAARLGEPYSLNGRRTNRLLAEIGWIQRHHKGWQLTPLGRQAGGVELEDERTGVPFVTWPTSTRGHPVFAIAINGLLGVDDEPDPSPEADGDGDDSQQLNLLDELVAEADLASDLPASNYHALDGHQVMSHAELLIDNWLYMAGLAHAYRRQLPILEPHLCDFYLPRGHVYIEYWGYHDEPHYLQEKMAKQAIYRDNNLNLIELGPDDLSQIDDILPRELLHFDVQVY